MGPDHVEGTLALLFHGRCFLSSLGEHGAAAMRGKDRGRGSSEAFLVASRAQEAGAGRAVQGLVLVKLRGVRACTSSIESPVGGALGRAVPEVGGAIPGMGGAVPSYENERPQWCPPPAPRASPSRSQTEAVWLSGLPWLVTRVSMTL